LVFNQTIRCQDHELIHQEKINMTIQIVGDSFIAIKPYSLTYDEKKMPNDTLRFRGKYTFFLFDNYGNVGCRRCYLAISSDIFYLDVYETCEYKYHINGR